MQQDYLPPYRMITVYQPWADLLVPDVAIVEAVRRLNPELAKQLPKDVENRGCGTPFRGTLIVHTGQAIDLLAIARFGLEDMEFARSAVLGVAHMTGVSTTSTSFWAHSGATHWRVTDPLRLTEKIPCGGFQGAGREPPPPILAAVLTHLEHQLQVA